MEIGAGALITILIMGVLLDFDAWKVFMALVFCGFFTWLLH